MHGISLAIPGNYSEECPVLTKWGECLGGKGGKSLGMSKKSTYAAFLRDSLAINEGIAKISIVININNFLLFYYYYSRANKYIFW